MLFPLPDNSNPKEESQVRLTVHKRKLYNKVISASACLKMLIYVG